MDNITWRPPVRRGDIEQLLFQHDKPGVIGLADGTFHSYPSVGHVELRDALETGWDIYGLCSMGAIRASEMFHMGMIPWGEVAGRFCRDRNFSDDEVALVHSAEAPYVPLSEPMLHLREFCTHAQKNGLLTDTQANTILYSLKQRWYGDRTIANFCVELKAVCTDKKLLDALLAATHDFTPYRLKQADLISFVIEHPWTEGARK
ncbi:TfuA-like protein [Herbaspirillum autotrophicum]|uniref:TfuA-like protein n=1 Tax=Herbaspirillum autotrophicum TaxID=180195 RepID=UPI0018DE3C70|nr:TfuA-like protein [Herbaspirillum autotrophicum]